MTPRDDLRVLAETPLDRVKARLAEYDRRQETTGYYHVASIGGDDPVWVSQKQLIRDLRRALAAAQQTPQEPEPAPYGEFVANVRDAATEAGWDGTTDLEAYAKEPTGSGGVSSCGCWYTNELRYTCPRHATKPGAPTR